MQEFEAVGKVKRGISLSQPVEYLVSSTYSSRNGNYYTIASNISIAPLISSNSSNRKFPTVTPIVAAAASASSVEIAGMFQPRTGSWRTSPPLNFGRYGHGHQAAGTALAPGPASAPKLAIGNGSLGF
jgi:hypothetical protein